MSGTAKKEKELEEKEETLLEDDDDDEEEEKGEKESLLKGTTSLYFDIEFKKIKDSTDTVLEEINFIKEKLNEGVEIGVGGSKINYKYENKLLRNWIRFLLYFVVGSYTLTLAGVALIIFLNGFLWMGIPDIYCFYMALMCSGVILFFGTMSILFYLFIRRCYVKRKVNKHVRI
jgi:hypothetical protein